jgi:hypothetical protein
MPSGKLAASQVVLPEGSAGLCTTLAFDWLKLMTEDFAASRRLGIDKVSATSRMGRLVTPGLAERHQKNRRWLAECSMDDIVSAATVSTCYYVQQDLNPGQGRFYPRTVRWKPWENNLSAEKIIKNASDEPAFSLLVTRQGTRKRGDNTHALTGLFLSHAIAIVYLKSADVTSLYDPNTGEYGLKGDAKAFWDLFVPPHAKNEGSGFGVFKLDPKGKLYGTLPELSALGQITPAAPLPTLP